MDFDTGPSSGSAPRPHRRLARGAVVLVAVLIAGVGGIVTAPPASASTIRCVQVKAGWGDLDTLKVCTELTLHSINSTVAYFTNCCRPGPRDVYLRNALFMNGSLNITVDFDCGPMPPGDKCTLAFSRDNPAGTQGWYTVGAYTSDHVGQITIDSARIPQQWESVGP